MNKFYSNKLKISFGQKLYKLFFCLILTAINLIAVNNITGQTTSASVKGGKAAGSYSLDNFDAINLFNGNLNFNMPLIGAGGRGEAGLTVPLTIETRWKLLRQQEGYYYEPEMIAGASITGHLTANVFTYNYYEVNPNSCGQADWQPQWAKLVLNFVTADGTSYKLRSTQNNGAPYEVPYCYPGQPFYNHGTEFVSWDGSGTKFISDTAVKSMTEVQGTGTLSGYLLLPNGTRYRIQAGVTTRIEDRNGNWTNLSYASVSNPNPGSSTYSTINDSLGRTITFEYNQNQSPYGYHTKITYKGFGGADRIIRISYKPLQDVLRPDQALKTYEALFPRTSGSQATDYPFLSVVSDLWLPDNRKYSFQYSSYGQLARVNLPTGGAYEYDYQAFTFPQAPSPGDPGAPYIRVSERRVYSDGINLTQKTTFSSELDSSENAVTTVDTHNSSGTRLSRSKNYFYGNPVPMMPQDSAILDEDAWNKGLEYKTETYASNGTTVLRKTDTEWEAGRYVTWQNTSVPGTTNMYRDSRIVEIKKTLSDSNQISAVRYGYDSTVSYNLRNNIDEYDYGQIASGQVSNFIRRTHIEFEKGASYTNNSVYLLNLQKESWVSSDYNGNNIVSRTKYEYDNYTSEGGANPKHAALLARSNIVGHASTVPTNPTHGVNYVTRGNATAVKTYANAQLQTGEIAVYSQYDIAGNIVKVIDAKGNASTVSYDDKFGLPDAEARTNTAPNLLSGQQTFAFATSATNAIGYTTYAQFDYYSGAGVDAEDINGNVSTTFYHDLLDRPTQTISANNRSAFRRQITVNYNDLNKIVTVTADSKIFGDNLLKSDSRYDGLGRTYETRQYENGTNYIGVLTEYDSLGRAYKTSNPYRSYLSEQPQWTTTSFDDLGRVKEVKSPDNGKIIRQYYGSIISIIDQASRSRTGVFDAIGRLTKVIEYEGSGQLETFYTYDILGRIRKTEQGAQSRYFMYDDLGRVIRAKQPEQIANSNLNITDSVTGNSNWSVKYQYDNNGNITSTTDSRNITVSGTYDNMNRLTNRDYSDSTPDVAFTFDDPNVQNSKGQLTAVVSSVSANYYTAFDELGRIKSSSQNTNGQTYNFPNYTYDLSGALVEQTYPSGRIVKTESDDVGRLSRVKSQKPNQTERTYISDLSYTSFGGISQARLGNGRWESAQFDAKTMQVRQIGLGYSIGNTSQLKIEYNYGTTTATASDNNGSLRQQKISYAGQSAPIIQDYNYDMLNRLKSATETVSGSQTWKQTFLYDRYGNRRFDTSSNNTTTLPQNNGIYNPNIDTNTNRFLVSEGYNYDSEGNLSSNPENQLFQYDAENRQTQVTNAASQTSANYFYDGSGKRVRKVIGQEETIFVYDAFGKMTAEYSTTIDTSRPKATSYLTSDVLGSPRIVTDGGGNVISRHDYLPFGEEVAANVGGRATTHGYAGNDGVRQQFTSYERDLESGLDFAQNRYFSSRHGRFTSVDPLTASANMKNPQTFNRYTYGLNSPYKFTDPLGLAPTQHCFNNICNTYDADERAYNWDTTFGAETARAEAEFDQRLGNTRSVNAANQAITRGDQATANAICASNSNIVCERATSESNYSQSSASVTSTDFVEIGSVPRGFAYVQQEILRIFGAGHLTGENNSFRILRTDVNLINAVESAALKIFRMGQAVEKWRLNQLADPESNPVVVAHYAAIALRSTIDAANGFARGIAGTYGDKPLLLVRSTQGGRAFESSIARKNLETIVGSILVNSYNIGIIYTPRPRPKRGPMT